jgi:site-specific recombinase XerD
VPIFLAFIRRPSLRSTLSSSAPTHAGRDPRIHDLRHTFAVRSLEQCGHDRTAVARHIVRDRAMLHLAFAAGMRVSELVKLRLDQIDRRGISTVHIMGKGHRERILPLWKETAAAVKAWLKLRPASHAPELFLNARAQAMTRSGFAYILAKHVATAARKVPSIAEKGVSPHVLRHTCAMHTLQATRDVRKVSLWLGHASLQSTEVYLRADPTEKLEALATMAPPMLKPGRFRAPDKLMAMLGAAGRKANYAE